MYTYVTKDSVDSPLARLHDRYQTDGLSDNVFPSEMVAICSLVTRQFQLSKRTITPVGRSEVEGSAEDQEVQAMAERIVDYARMCMHNTKRVSPFERAAAREGMYFRGGVSRCRALLSENGLLT